MSIFRPIMLAAALNTALAPAVLAADDSWADVISRVSESVVSLQLAQQRDFDESDEGVGAATGFVVDAENGIILTNRHVIGTGPMRATATFQNQERVDLIPLYRDPVHDFGFFRYDPAELRHTDPGALALKPGKVRVGMNIRVIGSDGGEQLSILAGTIARTDRDAPNYGRYNYNDFNTFYLQAASGTSGGSSGSPVIDGEGDVVALNAAANSRTASSFFLPLPRIAHALEKLRNNEPIERGTLQTIFRHRSYRDLRGLGLDETTEETVRELNPAATGLLTVSQVFPGGVADGALQEGDILLYVNGQAIENFVALEAILDERVGEQLEVSLLRQGEKQTLNLPVADLHALIPGRFLEIGDSILQSMSLQHARSMNLPQAGAVLANPGFLFEEAGVPDNALITRINGTQIHSLQDVLTLSEEPASSWMIRYVAPGREYQARQARIELDDGWLTWRLCERRDNAPSWACEALSHDPELAAAQAAPVVPAYDHPVLEKIAPAMVKVEYGIPFPLDNTFARHFTGTGLVVDPEAGLVAIDRNTVPVGMGQADITFFGTYTISAEVVFLHPEHNLALLRYDPAALQGAQIARPQFAGPDSEVEGGLFRLSFRPDGTLQANGMGQVSPFTVVMDPPRMPRFQQAPVDVLAAVNMPPSYGGPVVDGAGQIHAYWMSFAYEEDGKIHDAEWALPATVLEQTLAAYQAGQWYSIDARFDYGALSDAARQGLPQDWLSRYAALPSEQRRTLVVRRTIAGTDAARQLSGGDVLLTINGELVTDLLAAESLSQAPSVTLEVLSEGQVRSLTLETTPVFSAGTRRFISWAGAVFQEPHRSVALYDGLDQPGVYIADTAAGSPALWDGLYRNRLVTHINGKAVKNLDDLSAIVATIAQDEETRITTVSAGGRRDIISVSPEYYFWPTYEMTLTGTQWQRREIASGGASD
ncbi:trypsin-like peptidase domain-containing protein [Granulosicoccaceae sp. 1_MG-2023]|nr:trypsin-like peptidase domain-containing protein [Granulosicoccaceae sp. 1_MG-2023]